MKVEEITSFCLIPTFREIFEAIEDVELADFVIGIDDPRWSATLEKFKQARVFSIDIETFGKEDWHPLYAWKGNIRIVTVGISKEEVLLVDLGGWADFHQRPQIIERYEEFFDILRERGANWDVVVQGQNLKFDAVFLRTHFDVKLRNIRDSRLMSQVLWAGLGVEKAGKGENRSERCTLSHSLKAIAERVGLEVDKTEQKSNWGVKKLTNKQLNYAALDSGLMFEIHARLTALIRTAGCSFSAVVESICVSVFAEMEYGGFPVNIKRVEEVLAPYENEQQKVLQPFTYRWPNINWLSQQQVLEVLQKDLGLPIDSCGKDVLSSYSYVPVVDALLQGRTLNNAINYLKAIQENYFDGAIRTHFSQVAAGGSGRSSCSKRVSRKAPDTGIQLQNPISKLYKFPHLPPVREVFQAPEGYVLGVYDASASHARIAAQLSSSKMMLEIYRNDFDGHSVLAADILNMARKEGVEDITKYLSREIDADEAKALRKGKPIKGLDVVHSALAKLVGSVRDLSKTALYSSLNGSGVGKLTMAGKSVFAWFNDILGQKTSQLFVTRYPELIDFIKKTHREVSAIKLDFSHFTDINGNPLQGIWGYNKTLTGRRIYFKHYPGYKDNTTQVSYTDCTSSNWLLPESDIMKSWGAALLRESDKNPQWDLRFVNFAHDEWDIIWKAEYTEEVLEAVWQTMKSSFERWITLIPFVDSTYDPKSGMCQNWSEK